MSASAVPDGGGRGPHPRCSGPRCGARRSHGAVPRRPGATRDLGGGRGLAGAGASADARRSTSVSWRSRRGCRSRSTARALAVTRSCADSPAPGKTYSLGVLLERLLMETSVRVLVLDPNSDYVGLSEARTGADPAAAERYVESAGRIVVRSGTSGESRLGLHFRELEGAQQAALLRLDPVADRDEYAELDRDSRGCQPRELRGSRAWRRRGSPARPPSAQPGRARVWTVVPRGRRLHPHRPGRSGHPLPGGGPRIARLARGAFACCRRRARPALVAAGGSRADGDRDRRGTQRLPGTPQRSARRAHHRDRRSRSRARGASSASTWCW